MFLRSSAKVLQTVQKTVLQHQIRAMAATPGDSLRVEHDTKNQRFVINLKNEAGDEDKGVLEYQWVKKGLVDLYHTGVPPAFRGQGIAQHLAKAAFEYVVEVDGKMRLSCTYLQKYAKDNPLPQYQDRIVPLDQ